MEKYEETIDLLKSELNYRHIQRLEDCESHGTGDGRMNLPTIDDETPVPFEFELRNQYQSDVHYIEEEMKTYLQMPHVEYMDLKSEIEKYNINPDAITQKKLDECNARENKKLDQLKENYDKKMSQLSDQNKSFEAPFFIAKQNLKKIQNKLHRDYLIIQFKSKWLYFLLLTSLGFSEFPLNKKIFENFRDDLLIQYIMTASLAIAIPVCSHFAGIAIKQRKDRKDYLIIAFVSIFLVVFLSFVVGNIRGDYIKAVTKALDNITTTLFVTLSLVLFLVGFISSFFRHDESHELEVAWRVFEKAEKKYLQNISPNEIEMKNVEDKFMLDKQKIQSEFNQERKDILNTLDAKKEKLRVITAKYDSLLLNLKSIEQKINNSFFQAINKYR